MQSFALDDLHNDLLFSVGVLTMKKQKRLWFLMAVVLALAFAPATASAGFQNPFFLDGSNLGGGFTGPFVQVTVNLTDSTHATITFDALTHGGFTYLLTDGGSAAVNVNASSWTLSNISGTNSLPGGFTPGPYSDGGSGNEDGFGSFNQTINSFDSFTHSSTEIVFTLTNTSGTWGTAANVLAANNNGNIAAAHIGAYAGTFGNGFTATGFAAGNGTVGPNFGVVPAPPSAVLLGVGALGFAGLLIRSRRRQLSAA
jgi:hypothetical protein